MTATTSKAAWLERIEQERQSWEQLLAEVGEERMQEPGVAGDWSFKDVVAHLNGWRILTLARLEAAQHGRDPVPPPWPAHLDEDDDGDLDAINDWIYQTNRERSLQDVLSEYGQSFDQMRAAVAAISEQDLNEPGRFPWLGGHALWEVLDGTFGHLHEEHEPNIREWLKRKGGSA